MRILKNIVMLMAVAIFCLVGTNVALAKEPVIADISKWQGNINWSQASKDLDFVIIRTQDGSLEDSYHKSYEKSAQEHGIPFGVYGYARYTNKAQAEEEAVNFYTRASKQTKFYVVDVEATDSGFTRSDIVANTTAFINKLKAISNKPVGLYTGDAYYKQYGLQNVKNRDFLWIARYGNNDDVAENWEKPTVEDYDLWQYTSQGNVLGIAGNVDLNKLKDGKTLETFFKPDITLAGTSSYYRTNPKKIVVKKSSATLYNSVNFSSSTKVKTVKANTILSTKAVKYTKSGTPRLQTTDGKYITANRKYVTKVVSNVSDFYTTPPAKIVVSKASGASTYSTTNFTSLNKLRTLPKNTLIDITGVEYTAGGTPRLRTANDTYITANKQYVKKVISSIDNYYTEAPEKVVIQKDNVTHYNSTTFNSDTKTGSYDKGDVVNITDVEYTAGGTPRLKTSKGTYITANKAYVIKTISTVDNYFTKAPEKVIVTKASATLYNSTVFSSATTVKTIKKGTVLDIAGIAFDKNGTPRLKTTSGQYLTANKSYVQETK
ncbi:DUF5776 domain-containing protein [Rummeliibacillus stabekisii]|uniref:DUF5776 domain-containing protein n=1 Tax=Rummeliibacillus stabekisii TaxID=241244 RepID=UPI0020426AD2|nr:DUF5776 domain-containing protein [Rummeliibacillus stabekisii]MCM3316952.1 DUF5776 domain-containing protein [Rummeliibacillus stabekisii]